MALTTLDEVKTFLGVTTSSQNARWDALRAAAELFVKRWCRRDFESQQYTQFLDGTGTKFLALRHRPVTAVAEVSLASRWSYGAAGGPAYAALTEGHDWALQKRSRSTGDTGVLVRLNGNWPQHPGFARSHVLSWEQEPGLGNVKCVYTAGFTVIPEDLKLAVAQVAAFIHRTAKRGGLDYSERLGDHSYMIPMARIREAPALGTVRSILTQYRESPW